MLTRRVGRMIHSALHQRFSPGIVLVMLLFMIGAVLPAFGQSGTAGQEIFMPLIPAYSVDGAPSPVPTVPPGTRVYGLLGTLEQPEGMRYTYYLSVADGTYYALAGQTPEVEQQISTLARSNQTSVKVWGEVQTPESSDEPPLIVMTGILATQTVVPTVVPPTPMTPTPVAGTSVPVATVKYSVVNLYGGPGTNFPVAGQVVIRQACEVTGRNAGNTWLQLTCADGQQGWVDARLVDVNGEVTNAPILNVAVDPPTPIVVTATPTPPPTPQSYVGWRTELFNNSTLSGIPVAVVDVANIDFDWGASGPSQVGADNFSIRFSRRITVAPAYYEFTAVADDGIRVWVDGRLILNAWPANPSQSYVAGLVLTDSHDLMVEYYEQSGLAKVRLAYAPASSNVTWNANYYFGTTPAGNPAFSQQEVVGSTPLDYNWGTGSATSLALGPNVLGNDYWSARWQGQFPFEDGNFVFRANVDDGIRLYIDGLLVLDYWRDGYKEVSNRVIGVGAGRHTITVEYYERTGNASVRVWWYRDSVYTGHK